MADNPPIVPRVTLDRQPITPLGLRQDVSYSPNPWPLPQGHSVVGALVYNTHCYASKSLLVGAPLGRDPGLSRLKSRSY